MEYFSMKIKKITTNSNSWFDLKNEVKVSTSEGVKTSSKFYFNGFHPTFKITMSDGNTVTSTYNHQFMVDNDWKRADMLEIGDTFNNGLTVSTIEDGGVQPTMDMEVNEVHHYILENGVMSHNSSFALGQVSPSIEPLPSNYFNKVLAKGNYTWRNPELAKVLEKYNQNTEETWDDIRDHRGSVQHLEYLTEHEKNVFKTFEEIVPLVIIQQAAARQKYIDQAQSLNLMIPHDTPIKDINSLIKEAWKLRVKTLYYQRSSNPSQELVRNILNCVACEA